MKNNKRQKGFTLIELLVVIAIIAILAVVVVLTLNPAELLRQARDSNRISDFATLKSALALYSTDVSTTTSMDGGTPLMLWSANPTVPVFGGVYSATTQGSWAFLGGETAITTTTSRSVSGTGWIPVNLNAISSGAPIGTYPVDPVNTGTSSAYVYAATATTWKVATMMESVKYKTGGPNDVETNDGGNSIYVYEQGSNLGL
ncbi:MAG TPA: type II secretion system protein [Candidatus Paceibacterota bacterium]|nr:type II secretion system protein [Candidatus Paceibacterota bacterium]